MKNTSLFAVVAVVSAFASTLLATGCSSDAASDAAAPGEPGAAGSSGGATPSGASEAEINAACDTFFDALQTHGKRCGNPVLGMDTFETARPGAIAVCRQRSKSPGTGYTPAFHRACAAALDTLACGDTTKLIEACAEPRGQLPKGTPCAMDDQCADGYCQLPPKAPKGSTCGTCAVPVWIGKGGNCDIDNAKCRSGMECKSYQGSSRCSFPSGPQTGPAKVGQACSIDSSGRPVVLCEAGADCTYDYPGHTGDLFENRRCVQTPGLGQEYTNNYTCDSWLVRGADWRCQVEEVLDCR
jgi:hypothetical protein